ncbi:MAG: DUF4252 domain-containing protein [Acidobacteria bacterium]|nr:DUF4252 domain-containing protein [Acidobacteriota bacterium]
MSFMVRAAKRSVVLILIMAFCLAFARAQDARLDISHLDKLADKAAETIEVSLDERLLQLAAKFLNSKNPDEARVKDLVSGLKGVYVRVFEFDNPGEYATSDIEALYSQLHSAGWTKIVGVRSKRDGQKIDVQIKYLGNSSSILGLTIIAAEPKELTVVNIVGPIDLDKLSQLEGQFGIPKLGLEKINKGKSRN